MEETITSVMKENGMHTLKGRSGYVSCMDEGCNRTTRICYDEENTAWVVCSCGHVEKA